MQCNDGCTNYKQEYWEYRQEYWEYWSTDRNTGVQTGILEYRQEYWEYRQEYWEYTGNTGIRRKYFRNTGILGNIGNLVQEKT